MTTEINTKWDYEKLNDVISGLINEINNLKFCFAKDDKIIKIWVDKLEHAIEFIEYNMKQLEVISPTEHYLTHE